MNLETHAARPAPGRVPIWRRLSWRLGASFLALTAAGILVSGLLQYRAQDRWLRQSLGSLLLNIARTGALLVDGDLHAAVTRAGRTDTAEYAAVRRQLARIQEVNQLADPVYTLVGVEDGRARFAVISQGDVPVGGAYALAPAIRPALARVLGEGVAGYTDVYTNEHGTWITAFAPVRDAAGRPVAALDVDFRADVYLAELAAVRRRLYLYSLVAAALALLAGVVWARHITRPLGQVTAVARAVVEGDLTARARLTGRDEIGMLGNVFHLMVERLQLSHRSVVDVLVRALEARQSEPGSLTRLAAAARAVGERLPLTAAQREALELGALLHDIGEIRTPEAILAKPGPLTADERRVVEAHPTQGAELLETVPLLTPALDVVEAHHERYDGSGYPRGLRADEIPLTARIFAVVDVLDAMTHDRPYRPAHPLAAALAHLAQAAGKAFDPRVVEATLALPSEQWTTMLEITTGDAGSAALAQAAARGRSHDDER